MKILILTQYYPPETGAPQNRLHNLATFLLSKGVEVSVLTAMPNYPQMKIYKGYEKKWYCTEKIDAIQIHRCKIYVSSNRDIISRLLNYFSFVITSLFIGLIKIRKQDFILCESPPLFLGITALLLKKAKGAKLIFNVSDLWPESAEKLGIINNKFLLNISYMLEEYLYRHSHLITCQTQGIVNNIAKRIKDKRIWWFRNGIDFSFFNPQNIIKDWRTEHSIATNDFILCYAGIIGYAQGLDVIIKAAKLLKKEETVKFVIIGNGPEKQRLINLANDYSLSNIIFFDALNKNEIPALLKAINAAIIPLKKLELFKGAIPSKTLECLAMSKPVLLGVEGEAYQLFVEQGKCALAFEPENETDLTDKILYLYKNPDIAQTLGNNGYNFVKEYFNRDIINEEFFNLLFNK
ncbi:MAG: glycosyltransferase family 4 protein [Bacteroidales bacterium]|nr:glycosyltransferase family 4 protein [Bacteroidales bacterium]